MKSTLCLCILLFVVVLAASQQTLGNIDRITSQFKQHDTDSDNLLTKEELLAFIEAKIKQQTPKDTPDLEMSQKFYQQAFVSYLLKYDKDKNGLNMEQFGQILRKEVHSEHKQDDQQQAML